MAVRVTLTFPKGAVVRLEAAFTDDDGIAVDPSTVRVRYKPPSSAEVALTYNVNLELVRDGVGMYHADIASTEAGVWNYRWEGTGVAQAVAEAQFRVAASVFA